MRHVAALAVVLALTLALPRPRAEAAPPAGWADAPAMLAAATAAVDAELRACIHGKLPRGLLINVGPRKGGGRAAVGMPIDGLGYRGPTEEETCLGKVIAKIVLPAPPDHVEGMRLGIAVLPAGTAPTADPAWASWRDLPAALGALLDADHRAALAACDRRPRTVRVILDRRGDATRVWLPAWQFHSGTGDGTTPPAEARVKACLTGVLRTWKPALLPRALVELQLAIPPGTRDAP